MSYLAFLPLIGQVLDKILPDQGAKEEAKLKVMELVQSGELTVLAAEKEIGLAQIGVNTEDAKSQDKFQRRWRPAAGWVCVVGLLYTFLIQPLLPWTMSVVMLLVGSPMALPTLPPIDIEYLMALLGGLLGLGGFRTFERIKGKA